MTDVDSLYRFGATTIGDPGHGSFLRSGFSPVLYSRDNFCRRLWSVNATTICVDRVVPMVGVGSFAWPQIVLNRPAGSVRKVAEDCLQDPRSRRSSAV